MNELVILWKIYVTVVHVFVLWTSNDRKLIKQCWIASINLTLGTFTESDLYFISFLNLIKAALDEKSDSFIAFKITFKTFVSRAT